MIPGSASASRRPGGDPAREWMLFGILFLAQASIYAWLILGHRIMKPHDTYFEYLLQYLFLAHSCQNPDLPLWLPWSFHGVISNWFANFQGGLLQSALLFAGGVPEGTNMLPVFYAGMFLDELVLLVGTWSLSRKFYASPYTRFFVSAAVVGSTFWATQFNFNLKLFYGVPLLLSLIHQFLDGGKRWPLFVAANFSALQFSGCISYLPAITLVVVLGYFLVHAMVFPAVWVGRLKALHPRPADLLIVLVNAAVLLSIYAVLSDGGSAIRIHRPGRGSDATVTLDAFLTYAGTFNPGRYADFFLGAAPSMDYTVYCGASVPILALAALLAKPGRTVLHLVLCVLLLLFFSMGFLSPVAAAAYEIVPLLRYARYVSLIAPLVKLFLIFLSGYGFEALIAGKLWQTRLTKTILVPVLLALGGITILSLLVLKGGDIPSVLGVGSSGLANREEAVTSIPVVATGAATLILAGFLLLAQRGSLSARTCLAFFLVLETADVFRWKIGLLRQETVRLNDAQYALQQIHPLPYIPRRSPDYEASERFRTMEPLFGDYGARYDLIDGFCHVDPPMSRYVVHYWMPPFESLVQVCNGRPPDRKLEGLPGFGRQRLKSAGDPYAKIFGVSADKLQVFRKAHVSGSDQALADTLNHPDFRGDLLLLCPRPDSPAPAPPADPAMTELLAISERIDVRPEVLHFDLNVLSVKIDLPPGEKGGWLFYSDVWNPGWTATVNGKSVPVERAFLAYKAVPLEAGANLVTFRFRAPLRVWCYRVVGLASVVFIVSCMVLTVRLFVPGIGGAGAPAGEP